MAHAYEPTMRFLALAAQLAPRLPMAEHGRRGAEELHHVTGLDAYVAVPSYGHVTVVARAGDAAPQIWTLLPALSSAAGHLLLAHRDGWLDSALWAARRTLMLPSACPLKLRKSRVCRAFVGSGSDGTRTRDLRRDRPAL
jgi:DNA-binding IclR family transcriptional regulator